MATLEQMVTGNFNSGFNTGIGMANKAATSRAAQRKVQLDLSKMALDVATLPHDQRSAHMKAIQEMATNAGLPELNKVWVDRIVKGERDEIEQMIGLMFEDPEVASSLAGLSGNAKDALDLAVKVDGKMQEKALATNLEQLSAGGKASSQRDAQVVGPLQEPGAPVDPIQQRQQETTARVVGITQKMNQLEKEMGALDSFAPDSPAHISDLNTLRAQRYEEYVRLGNEVAIPGSDIKVREWQQMSPVTRRLATQRSMTRGLKDPTAQREADADYMEALGDERTANRLRNKTNNEATAERQAIERSDQVKRHADAAESRSAESHALAMEQGGEDRFLHMDKMVEDLKDGLTDHYILESQYALMVDAYSQNNAIGDLGLVFTILKIFDPDSVSREGEVVAVKKTEGIPQQLWNRLQLYLKSDFSNRLGADVRDQMMDLAKTRVLDSTGGAEQSEQAVARKLRLGFKATDQELDTVIHGVVRDDFRGGENAEIHQWERNSPFTDTSGSRSPEAVQQRLEVNQSINEDTGEMEFDFGEDMPESFRDVIDGER